MESVDIEEGDDALALEDDLTVLHVVVDINGQEAMVGVDGGNECGDDVALLDLCDLGGVEACVRGDVVEMDIH